MLLHCMVDGHVLSHIRNFEAAEKKRATHLRGAPAPGAPPAYATVLLLLLLLLLVVVVVVVVVVA